MNGSKENFNLQQLLNSAGIKKRFSELLDNSSASFISSILAVVRNNSKLQDCSPNSIFSAAGIAAALKLPINPSLGFAYIVPYKGQAQFQLGWRGYVQLAMRTNQYRTLNAGAVYEGQIKEIDFITGEIVRGEKISEKIVGYVAYMELLNGFSKIFYMSVDELKEHAEKYSQSYAYDLKSGKKSSVWSTNFDAMAKKTVLKLLLNKFGIVSIDQQSLDLVRALQADQAVITEEGLRYIDNESEGEENLVPFDNAIKPSDFEENNSAQEISEEKSGDD